MTDLERARLVYRTIDAFGWDISWKSANPIPDDAWPIDIIAKAIAAARREGAEAAEAELKAAVNERDRAMQRHGAEEMRERAAQWHDEQVKKLTDEKHQYWVVGYRELEGYSRLIQWHADAARALRALPLTPEEPP